jgi:hypothetical protein
MASNRNREAHSFKSKDCLKAFSGFPSNRCFTDILCSRFPGIKINTVIVLTAYSFDLIHVNRRTSLSFIKIL